MSSTSPGPNVAVCSSVEPLGMKNRTVVPAATVRFSGSIPK